MTRVFFRDGFVDRYRGTRLVYPPVLRLLSSYVPEEFPFQEHWKMSETHIAYWELLPTIDHITPVARRGEDSETNAVCCSQLTNSAKSNWTLEELEWQLLPPGDLTQWDGMAGWFLRHVEAHPEVLKIRYVKQWYDALAGLKGDQRLCAKALEAVPELKHYFEKTF
ncbi:MAG: HNH endonuclease domain-containing protein [Anaerolineae bacterium]